MSAQNDDFRAVKEMTDENHDRRDFFRRSGRLAMLGLGALAGTFLVRRRQIAPSGQTCVGTGICSSCGAYQKCGLPQAESRRQALTKSKT